MYVFRFIYFTYLKYKISLIYISMYTYVYVYAVSLAAILKPVSLLLFFQPFKYLEIIITFSLILSFLV